MSNKLHILQHALGVDQYGQGRQYRNHFCTGPGSTDFTDCRELVSEGLMTERAPSAISGGDRIFIVTAKGVEYVALNSPKPPKLTRSQKRYQDFLDADSGLRFAEWIGVRRA